MPPLSLRSKFVIDLLILSSFLIVRRFDRLCALSSRLAASFERSIRRALHRMVDAGELIAIGDGGRGDPYRYFFHPIGIAIMCDKPEASALWKALEADPGTEEALVRLRMREKAAAGAE